MKDLPAELHQPFVAQSEPTTLGLDDLFTRNVAEIINPSELKKLLTSGKKLRVKLGIDPTSPHLHLGRAVVLHTLRTFQDLGHTAIFIVGDFTGTIGDTSDKDAERPMLQAETVKKNLESYLTQAFKILKKEQTEIHYNSEWLGKLDFAEIGKLADAFSVHDFIVRENIKKRLDAGKRVSLRELLYPLMQGYDSVMVQADVELGGTDQRFNMLAGRTLQPLYGQPAQQILMVNLIAGTDCRKMSSSWGNTVNILDEPEEMFGKLMRVPDELMRTYFYACTRLPKIEIEALLNSSENPRDVKLQLAGSIVNFYHGREASVRAATAFVNQFSKGELPSDIPEHVLPAGEYEITQLLFDTRLVESKSEARRLIEQNGVKVDQSIFNDKTLRVTQSENKVLQVGKRKFIKLTTL